MLRQTNSYQLEREQVVDALARLREGWEAIAEDEGCSLIDIDASVGLMLGDVAMMLGLSSTEQKIVLGDPLRREFLEALKAAQR